MTPDQQLRCIGISAEHDDGHIIIRCDRRLMSLTPREIEVFYGHLRKVYREAMDTRKATAQATGVLV